MTARTNKPRKRKTTVEEEIVEGITGTDEPVNEFDISLESVQDTETLNAVLDQFGQRENVLFRIYKQTPNGNSFCYETPEYNVSFLQRERGAGIYTIRIFINGKHKKSVTEIVEAPGNTGSGASGPAPATGDSHAQFLEKLLMVLITQQSAGTHAAPSLTDITQSLANIDALRGKQESGMEMFKQGMEMAKTMLDMAGGGGGDWKTEGLRMVREAIPGITSIVQARTQPAPPATTVPQEPVMMNPEQMTDDQRKGLLKQTIAYLKNQFIAGLPPESALDFIIANSQSPQYQAVIRAVLSYSFEDIGELDSELKPEQPFHAPFRFIYDGLRSQFTPADPMDDDPRRNPGDDEDLGNNVPTGKTRKS